MCVRGICVCYGYNSTRSKNKYFSKIQILCFVLFDEDIQIIFRVNKSNADSLCYYLHKWCKIWRSRKATRHLFNLELFDNNKGQYYRQYSEKSQGSFILLTMLLVCDIAKKKDYSLSYLTNRIVWFFLFVRN